MSGNFVSQAITSTGTGALTLGASTAIVRQTVGSVIPVGHQFRGAILFGNNYELGVFILTAAQTINRVQVQETAVEGALNRTDPVALDVTLPAMLIITPDVGGVVQAPLGLPYQDSAGAKGRPSHGSSDVLGLNTSLSALRKMFPYERVVSGNITDATIYVHTAVAGATLRAFIYEALHNGSPGLPLGEFTSASPVDISTPGRKVMVPTNPIYAGSGEFFICMQASDGGCVIKGPGKTPYSSLGTSGTDIPVGSLHRGDAFANIGGDETGNSWTQDASHVTTFLNG